MEGTTAPAAARRAVGAATLAEAFRITVADHPDRVAVRTKDDEVSLTWAQLAERVDALAGGLHRLGVRHGDTVGLMIGNRPEFHVADLAAMTLGATPFSVYLTSAPEQVAYVVGDAAADIMIVERAYAGRVPASVRHTILVEDWDDMLEPGFDSEPHWRAVQPDDLLTLIYTSGTTGPPKGVQIAHRNQMAAVGITEAMIELPEGAKVISWLPSAHIAERTAHHYLPIVFAMTVTSCPDPRQILSYLPAVRPSWFFAVPRIFEKLKSGLEAYLGQDDTKRAWLEASARKVELEQAGETVPADLAATVAEADAQLFAGLRHQLGLDEAVSVNVGAAPTPREVIVFFHAIGIPLAELWGMSETCGAGCCNPPGRVKIGTVGPPSPGVDVKLASERSGDEAEGRGRGELLMRSAVNMVGYRNLPERTAEALDADGWLHTGDIAQIDADGYVRIVDRKKEIIINAAGKNMSPANIEATVKGASPLIGQAVVIGDARPFNTALITLDPDFAAAWASQQGIEGDLGTLAGDERVRAAVEAAVQAGNAKLARVEQIKRFTLLETDWLPGGDELTPTMKLKRRPIADKYAAQIDAMYA